MTDKELVHSGDLKESCVTAAHQFIAEFGVDKLSLREVARCLGVSHQAPYKHYPSKDHLLAEVMRRCFKDFADFLDSRDRKDNPRDDLRQLGIRYQEYALKHPVEYRLMFNTAWPSQAQESGLAQDSTHAFNVLRSVLVRIYGDSEESSQIVDNNAMFIWVNMHGLASILRSDVMKYLDLEKSTDSHLTAHIFQMISAALDVEDKN